VRQVAAEQRIPARFLPLIMRDLVRAKVVEGTTGRTGGYQLARAAAEISLLDIVEAVEGDSRRGTCIMRGGACATSGTCDVHAVVVSAQQALRERLAGVSLADLNGSVAR
jgi:Rrf2 family protein